MIVLAINAWNEPEGEVKRFVNEQNLKQRMLLEGGETGKRYGVSSIPTVLWIDPTGTVVDTKLGFHGGGALERKTKRLLVRSR